MNNNNLHKVYPVKSCQKQFNWVYLVGFCLILFLPLLTIPPWFVPASWGSSIVFRIILSVLIFFFIYQLLFYKDNGEFKSVFKTVLDRKNRIFWPFWLLVALLAIYLLATIFSLDPRFSFWGSPWRSGGSLNFSLFIIFAILAFIVFRQRDWKKIWFFAFIAGILVCAIAFIQKFELFKTVFIPSEWQPYSTLGGPTFLALYLLLLSFLPLSFGIDKIHPVKSDKVGVPLKAGQFNRVKKSLFYFFCSGLFILTIFIASGRAALLGLVAGFLFFLFFYPAKSYTKKLVLLKILTLIIFVGGIAGTYWLNGQPQIIQSLKENRFLNPTIERIFLAKGKFSLKELIVNTPRFSAWKVSWEAIKERPILGYGPENLSIGFDKYYNPTLHGLENEGSWWDKAHNFIFDIGVTAGIPALIIYLAFFGVLFWELRKLKKRDTNNAIVAHGIQATFISYLVASLFSFDIFSTYLVLFLIIGYSLFFIQKNNLFSPENSQKRILRKTNPAKSIILIILFFVLIWFIWSYNLKLLKINKELNWADYYSNTERCQKAFENTEEILAIHSVIDSYVRLKYVNVIGVCIIKGVTPQNKVILAQKAIELLKEVVELMPYYTRSWFLLGGYMTTTINNTPNLDPAVLNKLKEEAYSYFEKAHQLRPKSQMMLKELVKADLSLGRYEKAKEEAQKCINIKPDTEDCWWLMGLTNIYLGEDSQAKENMEKAVSLGFSLDSEKRLLPLMEAYAAVKNYQELIEVYKQLLMYNNLPQYHASLATVYKEVGDYENARKEAIKVLQLAPETKAEVEEFLKTIPLK